MSFAWKMTFSYSYLQFISISSSIILYNIFVFGLWTMFESKYWPVVKFCFNAFCLDDAEMSEFR